MTQALVTPAPRSAAWLAASMIVVAASQFALAQEPPKNFVMHDAPKPLPTVAFEDGKGRARSLADFKGKVVLLNIWATWCGPCRKEMPALDRLQATLGGPDFEVLPVSIDRGGVDAVGKFYAEIGVHDVGVSIDASGQAVRAVGAVGLPTTLLIDRAGREIGRLTGPAEWDEPEVVEFLKHIIAKQKDAAASLAQGAHDPAAQAEGGGPGRLRRGFQWLKALFTK